MAFTSAPELMIVIALAFFLFGVPLMGLLVAIKERRARERARKGDEL